MRLFDLFGRDRIEPAWQYQAKSWLWHVRPTDVGAIVGEERDPERKETAFFCVNRDTGQLLWREASFGDRWWIGLESVHRDMVFLHGFITPDMPQHRGITAVDLFTGRKLWERPELRFAGAQGGRLLAAEGSPASERFCTLSRLTGRTEAAVGTDEALAFLDESAQLDDVLRFPVPLESAAGDDPSIESLVRARLVGIHTAGPVSVLLHGSRLLISCHEHANFPDEQRPVYNNMLLIIERTTGKDVFAATLDRGIGALVLESFFVQRNTLYCIRERRTLMAVPLGSANDTTAS